MNSIRRLAARYLRALEDEGFVNNENGTRYWGRAGAGMLFTTGDRVLLLQRSNYVEQPGTWGIPGGAIQVDNRGAPTNPLDTAKQEVEEELGFVPRHKVIDRFVFRDGSFQFTTFIARVDEIFTPRLNWENTHHRWVYEDELSTLTLHFGVKALLRTVRPFE